MISRGKIRAILTEMTGNGGSLPTTQRSDVKVNIIAIYREPL